MQKNLKDKCFRYHHLSNRSYDKELNEAENVLLYEHFKNCDSCRLFYQKLQTLKNYLQTKPLLEIEASVILNYVLKEIDVEASSAALKNETKNNSFVSEKKDLSKIDSSSKLSPQKSKQQKYGLINKVVQKNIEIEKEKKWNTFRKKFSSKYLLLIIPIILAISFWYYNSVFLNTSPWKIISSSGIKFVNGKIVSTPNIYAKDLITTTENSAVDVNFYSGMDFSIYDNSAVRVLKTRADSNIIYLEYGKLGAKIWNWESNFVVKTNFGSVFGNQASFRLTTENDTAILIENFSGLINIKQNQKSIVLPNNYTTRIFFDGRMQTPFHKDSELEFKKYLMNFDLSGKFENEIERVLEIAKPSDAFTLWLVIQKSEGIQREAIIDKLNDLFPMPPDVIRDDIINLDQNKMNRWFEDFEWKI
ncbi:MAG: hypothetical protein C0425_00360 [Chlorobiaceae bacterium]|nr:hypothetical protein [Chlorobiaceae bacterium]MBA4308776.1 hypothetical protein [Chlorobiaceae bacterium]